MLTLVIEQAGYSDPLIRVALFSLGNLAEKTTCHHISNRASHLKTCFADIH